MINIQLSKDKTASNLSDVLTQLSQIIDYLKSYKDVLNSYESSDLSDDSESSNLARINLLITMLEDQLQCEKLSYTCNTLSKFINAYETEGLNGLMSLSQETDDLISIDRDILNTSNTYMYDLILEVQDIDKDIKTRIQEYKNYINKHKAST